MCGHALKGLALLRAKHSGEIALVGSYLKRCRALFARAAATETKIGTIISPNTPHALAGALHYVKHAVGSPKRGV
jgi:hypothetical protein